MNNLKLKSGLTSALTALAFTGLSSVGLSTSAHAQVDDEVIVTGSFIKRKSQADLASPLAVVGSVDVDAIGAQNIADITQTLTFNTGSQNNPDAFTQNATTGTSNINLRGLGLQSTLVLLNGKRNALSATQTNTGVSFVDTNSLIPLIALDRQEILLDGASALYGSDAVAGVVNFITKENVDGFEGSFDYQFHTPGGQSQRDLRFEGLYGKTFDRGSFLVAGSYVDRTPLTTDERRLSVPFGANQDVSSLGNPGSFFLAAPAGPLAALAGAPIIDPTGCADQGGNALALGPNVPGVGQVGLCQFEFGDFFNLVPDEERINLYAQADYDITDSISFSLDGSFTTFESIRNNSPSLPFLQTAVVGGDAPTNAFSAALGAPTPVVFFGRVLGNGAEASIVDAESDTYRFSVGLSGDNFLNNGSWDVSYTRGQNDFLNAAEDTVTGRFQCALNGLQGTAAPNPSTGGATTCENFVGLDGASIPVGEFFNPFATSFSTTPNSEAILDFVQEFQVIDSRSTLDVIDAVFTSDLIEGPSGPISAAVGFQYRRDEQSRDFDDISNADQFGFVIGGNDFEGSTDVFAGFGELAVPVTDWIDLQLALRYENFGGEVGDTLDPKVAILARPTDWVSLRGSYSTSFRAPTTFQQIGESTTLNQVVDPNGGTAFAAVRAFGSEELSPETSRAFNAGFTVNPLEGLTLSVDYYNFAFEDAISIDSFQALVNANPTDSRTFVNGVATTACLAENTIVCRAGDAATGTITQVNTNFINASSIDTSGFDLNASWAIDSGSIGVFTPSIQGTLIDRYEIQVDADGPVIDGLGNRNFTNIADPTPQLRYNFGLNWSLDSHNLNFFARRIGGLIDDQNPGSDIERQTRFDLRYAYDLGGFVNQLENAVFSVGVTNLTNEEPPFVATNGGFESRISDPRGRLVNFGLDVKF